MLGPIDEGGRLNHDVRLRHLPSVTAHNRLAIAINRVAIRAHVERVALNQFDLVNSSGKAKLLAKLGVSRVLGEFRQSRRRRRVSIHISVLPSGSDRID